MTKPYAKKAQVRGSQVVCEFTRPSSKTDPQEASQSLEKASKTMTLSVFRHFWSKRPHERSETLPEAFAKLPSGSEERQSSSEGLPRRSWEVPKRLQKGPEAPKEPQRWSMMSPSGSQEAP